MSNVQRMEAISNVKKRKYKCPFCDNRYDRVRMITHIEKKHPEYISDDYTATRIVFNLVNKKEKGTCVMCGKESPWNEEKGRYDRFCSPECIKAYTKLADRRLKDVTGKTKQELLKDPEYQNKVMLSHRSISGEYTFQDGSKKKYVGTYEKNFLRFMDVFLNIKSEDIETPGPIIDYEYKGKKHKWITDAYYAPYNLVFDIKDGGDNPNNREMPEYRAKQDAKEDAIKKLNKYNYIRLTDNKFEQLIQLMMELKELYVENNGEYNPIIRINESSEEIENIQPINEISTESIFGRIRIDNKNNLVIIKGINYDKMLHRITEMYKARSIKNLFDINYSKRSELLWRLQKINGNKRRISNLTVDLFFAQELYNIFMQLGDFYNMNFYRKMGNYIKNNTYIQNLDKDNISVEIDLNRLRSLNPSYKPKEFQLEFIKKYFQYKKIYDLDGYILSFDQGLGKTFTASCIAEIINPDQVIIICMNSLKDNWANEIKSYFSRYEDNELFKRDVFVYGKPGYKYNNKTKYIIVNNESINKIFGLVKGNKTTMIIVDESQNFRNLESAQTKNMLKLKEITNCQDNLIMSGTPIKANPSEIAPALMMIDRRFTENLARVYVKSFKGDVVTLSPVVQDRFNRTIYRKTKDQVLNLPPKTVTSMKVRFKDEEPYLLSVLRKEIKARFDELFIKYGDEAKGLKDEFRETTLKYSTEDRTTTLNYIKFIDEGQDYSSIHDSLIDIYKSFLKKNVYPNITNSEEIKRYRYIVSTYVYTTQKCLSIAMGEILPKARRDAFIELYDNNAVRIVDMIKNNTKKTVIFSTIVDVVNHIYEDLLSRDIGAVKIIGSTKDRTSVINRFKEDDTIDVIVATSQTIGTGVTLTEASQIFIFGQPYRKADFDQACDRIYRIGQTHPVFIYNVTGDCTAKDITNRMSDIMDWSGEMTDSIFSNITNESVDMVLREYTLREFNEENGIINESLIINKDDSYYNFDKFKSGECNILFITGFSGSGKTTLTKEYSKKYKAEVIEIDNFECYMDRVKKNDGSVYSEFLYNTEYGLKYIEKYMFKNNLTIVFQREFTNELMKFLLDYCGKRKNKKFIIEGMQIFRWDDYEKIKDYALIIKGTSALESILRRTKRNNEDRTISNMIDFMRWYMKDDKMMNKLHKVFDESYIIDEIDNSEDNEMIGEGYLLNKKDIYYNKDKFDSGEINLCFITGHSGSGKTTMGRYMQNEKNVETYELDDLISNYNFSDDNLKEYGDLIYSFFKGVGKQFRYHSKKELYDDHKWDGISDYDGYEFSIITSFVDYAIKYAKSHKNTKFVLEGVWIYIFFEPKYFEDYAVYIKGTSALISNLRGARRDSKDGKNKLETIKNRVRELLSNLKYRLIDEKDVSKFYNYFKSKMDKKVNESYINEIKAKDLGPKVCKKCGSKNIGVFFKGEPIYQCKDCGAFLGVVPFKHESIVTESSLDDNIDTLIFDFGDVLLRPDSEYVFMNYKFIPDEYKKKALKLLHKDYDLYSLGDILNYIDEEIPELSNHKNELIDLYSQIYPYDYTYDLLKTLKGRGYKLYYLSNWSKWGIEILKMQNRLSLLDLFDGGIFSYEVEMRKPDLDIYKYLIDKYNINPSKSVFFDDKEENIEAAKEVGLNGYVFNYENYDYILQTYTGLSESNIIEESVLNDRGSYILLDEYVDPNTIDYLDDDNTYPTIDMCIRLEQNYGKDMYCYSFDRNTYVTEYVGKIHVSESIDNKYSAEWIENPNSIDSITEAAINEDYTNFVNEEAVYDSKHKNSVYVILMAGNSPLSYAIRRVTKSDYTHCAISFDSSLKPFYSFGMKECLQLRDMGFAILSPQVKEYRNNKIKFSVYVMFVTDAQKKKMIERLKWFIDKEAFLGYDFIGLIKYIFNRSSDRNLEKWFCSRFVMEVIGQGIKISRDASLYSPQQVKDELTNISLVNHGNDFYHYDKRITYKNVRDIKNGRYNYNEE